MPPSQTIKTWFSNEIIENTRPKFLRWLQSNQNVMHSRFTPLAAANATLSWIFLGCASTLISKELLVSLAEQNDKEIEVKCYQIERKKPCMNNKLIHKQGTRSFINFTVPWKLVNSWLCVSDCVSICTYTLPKLQ